MRLTNFIEQNVEPILVQWEAFARSIWRGAPTDPATLRDDAKGILRATVLDMRSPQSLAQQSDKSMGEGPQDAHSERVDVASASHAAQRVASGFYLAEVVAEYRALRASVLRLWRDSGPAPDSHDLDDLTRFNESIDQSLVQAIDAYVRHDERNRKLLANEQAARMGAEAANRAKDIFLATLGHEMRTPLSAIAGWAHVLAREGCTKDDVRRAAEVITRNAAAQARMIDDVLDVSRIISGKLRLEIVACDLIATIGAAIDSMRTAAEAKGITLTAKLEPAARTVACDADRLQQVVWNLLSNAVKFTPPGGHVTITLSQDGEFRVIRVIDTGMGIEPEFLPHVFDRFQQADAGSRRQFRGLGLGLSIVKHVVELHGGTVEAFSAGLERGSTFTVRLPTARLSDAQNAEDEADTGSLSGDLHAPARSEPPVRLDGLRLLVVEDEADVLFVLVKLLEDAGATVTAASSAVEAMNILSNAKDGVDVLVSDIGMPEQDGFDLIRQVRSRGHNAKDLPAVALTAYTGKNDQRKALLAGFQAHVAKPVDPHDLTAVIASLAGRTGVTE